jgi:hypothetical protein
MASLVTLLVVIAIIRKKTVNKSTNDGQLHVNNTYYIITEANRAHGQVVTEPNPVHHSRGDTDTTTNHLPITSHETNFKISQNEAYIPTRIPMEVNQCYDTGYPNHLYATLEDYRSDITASQLQAAGDYDYVTNNL